MFKRVSRMASGQIAWLICVAHSTIIRGRLVHLCPAGCCGEVACADREKSIARAFDLYERVALTMITVPASNKWTSMDRNLRKEALLLSLWGITRRAMQRALKVDETDDPDVSIVVAAAPALQSPGVHKVLESAGAKKAVAFHADSQSEFNTLCWITCCSPAMRLHYNLFKNGRWLSHCPSDRDRLSTFDFYGSDLCRSPASALMAQWSAMLLEPRGSGKELLALLVARYGELASWPASRLGRLRTSLIRGICYVWLRIVRELSREPYVAGAIFDPLIPLSQRKTKAAALWAKAACCLDLGVTRVMKEVFEAHGELFGIDEQDFFYTLYERCVLTSTFVEHVFSFMTGISGTPKGLPSMTAKHCLHQVGNGAARWRTERGVQRTSGRCRPAWAQAFSGRGYCRRTGLHEFATYCSRKAATVGLEPQAWANEWRALSQLEKNRWAAKAKVSNLCSSGSIDGLLSDAAAPEELGGPWGLTPEYGEFPVSTYFVEHATQGLGSFKQLATDYRKV